MTALFPQPTTRTERYSVTLVLGDVQTCVDVADADVARELLATFADRHAGDPAAHGGIYDRFALATLDYFPRLPKHVTGEKFWRESLGTPWWDAVAARAPGLTSEGC